ncbi:MAG: alpha/beta fold hydrolase [Cytophagales bacterium]|nr:alpha/beta fold hydrolase [Cytophagales bacterium]
MSVKVNSSFLINCSDGVQLSAALFEPDNKAKAAVMIAPATGIKKTFYMGLATYLAEQGYGVICFENRGIGKSHQGNINTVNASLINWGKLDMTAVLEELKTQFPDASYHLIGHSAGGQLLGLMENALEIKSMFNYACSSGYIGNIPYPFKVQGSFFLKVFMPVSSLIFGQANNQWMGMGEPLPKNVALQWSKWCVRPGYVANDFGKAIESHFYDELTLPSKWVHATDDAIANLNNVKDMIRIYTKTKADILTLNPKESGFSSLGHMQFFSSKKKELWKLAVEWFEEHR